jgi:hypothetical protein
MLGHQQLAPRAQTLGQERAKHRIRLWPEECSCSYKFMLHLVQLLLEHVDALLEEALHVHHLRALVQLRRGLEAGQHLGHLGHVWPHLRL